MDIYLNALRAFDWYGEAIDDGLLYQRWRAQLRCLRDQQQAFDPTGEIWMGERPDDRMAPLPTVKERNE